MEERRGVEEEVARMMIAAAVAAAAALSLGAVVMPGGALRLQNSCARWVMVRGR